MRIIIKVNFYNLDTVEDNKLAFAVIMSEFRKEWVYVKHKERSTWEIPGGHRENNECIEKTASRELFEETGAKKFKLIPVCVYSVVRDENVDYTESFGQLFYAQIEGIDELPDFEIEKVKLFSHIPNKLTYPLIQPFLHNKVVDFLKSNKKL